MKYDVVIPAALPEVLFLHRLLPRLRDCLDGADKIFIITRSSYFSRIPRQAAQLGCEVIDEDRLVPGLTYGSVRDALVRRYPTLKPVPTGWYFQQFLKYGFALSGHCGGYYLTWDADTLPLRRLTFFSPQGRPYFIKKKEHHQPYFDTISRLLGLEKIVDYSFIAENMLFHPEIVRELVDEIERPGRGDRGGNWVEKIVNATSYEQCHSVQMFSEFETYGTFCSHRHPGLYEPRYLSTLREGGLINGRFISDHMLALLSHDIDIATFELRHTPPFPLSVGHYIYVKYLRLLYRIVK